MLRRIIRIVLTLILAVAAFSARSVAQSVPQVPTPNQLLAREIFAELIGINSTHDHGSTGPAAQAVARRLVAAGFPAADVQVVGPNEAHMNVVARMRGSSAKRPILLLAHLDVVEALQSDWTLNPFVLTEKDGFFYGRGSSDIKDEAAIFVATLIRLKKEGFTPNRDIILALTAGEEGGPDNGVQWLLANRKDLIDAAYSINGDGGDPLSRSGAVYARNVQASEKVYVNLGLETHNKGGHSSLPVKDNAIYHLAQALTRIGAYEFPLHLNEVTRGYFDKGSQFEAQALQADMKLVATRSDTFAARRLSNASAFLNAQLRTTCVATMAGAGHAENALPQTATANVNCRMLPDESPDTVLATIKRVIGDTAVSVTFTQPAVLSPPSPLVPEVVQPVERLTKQFWPGAVVVPAMETGATDGLYLRNAGMPVYGVSGVALDFDDIRAHGRDERIRVAAFYTGFEFTYQLVKLLGS